MWWPRRSFRWWTDGARVVRRMTRAGGVSSWFRSGRAGCPGQLHARASSTTAAHCASSDARRNLRIDFDVTVEDTESTDEDWLRS